MEDGPPKLSEAQERYKDLLYQTGRAQRIGAEVFSISGIPVAFQCVKAGLMEPRGMVQRLICLFRLSTRKGGC